MILLMSVGFCLLVFFEDFCIYVHQRYWPIVFFFCDIFVWFGIRVMVASENEFGSVPFSSIFLEEFEKDGC